MKTLYYFGASLIGATFGVYLALALYAQAPLHLSNAQLPLHHSYRNGPCYTRFTVLPDKPSHHYTEFTVEPDTEPGTDFKVLP